MRLMDLRNAVGDPAAKMQPAVLARHMGLRGSATAKKQRNKLAPKVQLLSSA